MPRCSRIRIATASSAGRSTWPATDPLNADTNGNGLSDLVDVRRRNQAANPDSDADGIPDVVELATGTNPFAADSDGDGTADLLDAFPPDPRGTQLPPPE
jgi:hypothetical protein